MNKLDCCASNSQPIIAYLSVIIKHQEITVESSKNRSFILESKKNPYASLK